MKLLKLLIVPAVLLFSVVMAVPVLAHNTQITNLKQKDCQGGKFCIHLDATTDTDSHGRDILLTLQGHNATTDKWEDTKLTIKLNLPNGTKGFDECFTDVAPSGFDKFRVQITVADEVGNDLTLDTTATNLHKVLDKDGKVVALVSDALTDCPPAQTTPSPPTPTSTATAAAATTLAGTGGFDFRYPLVGLTALVAGLALLLVSASRGRSSTK